MDLNVGIEGFKHGANILSVDVPEYLRRRIVTKLSWYDEVLGGQGAAPSSVFMFTGTPGAGKTTAMLQLADQVTSLGHVALFNTGEESLHQVKLTVERLKLKNGFIAGQETFTRPNPKKKEIAKVKGLLPYAQDIYNKQVVGQKAKDGSDKTMFLIIDSLQTMNDGFYGYDTNGKTPERVAKELTDWAKKVKNVIVIFIGQVTKGGEFAGKNVIKHMIDGHIHLYIDEAPKSETYGQRIMACFKNRFGVSGTQLIISLDEKGLKLAGRITYS